MKDPAKIVGESIADWLNETQHMIAGDDREQREGCYRAVVTDSMGVYEVEVEVRVPGQASVQASDPKLLVQALREAMVEHGSLAILGVNMDMRKGFEFVIVDGTRWRQIIEIVQGTGPAAGSLTAAGEARSDYTVRP